MSPPFAVQVKLSCLLEDDFWLDPPVPLLFSVETEPETYGEEKLTPADTASRSIFSVELDAAIAEASFVL